VCSSNCSLSILGVQKSRRRINEKKFALLSFDIKSIDWIRKRVIQGQ
jgi:hypothetical protein